MSTELGKGHVYHLIDSNGKTYESTEPGLFGGHRKKKIYGRLDCPSAARYIAKGQYVKFRVFLGQSLFLWDLTHDPTKIYTGRHPCLNPEGMLGSI